jgi:gliding motility-associated-like protein
VVLPGTFAFPNVFTPNGDGKNDLFGPYLPNGSTATFPYLRIYNNWGQLVYECVDCDFKQSNTGWDGTFKGSAQPNGTYQFVAEVKVPDTNDPTKFDSQIVHKPLTLVK